MTWDRIQSRWRRPYYRPGTQAGGGQADGYLRAWGNNEYAQLTVPAVLGPIKDAAGGYLHTVALDANGTVYAWGAGSTSPPTNASPDNGQSIVPSGLGSAVRVGAGYYHSIAQKSDGTLRLWGLDNYGQCSTVPTNVAVTDFAGGGFHTVVSLPDGTVQCYGAGLVNPPTNVQPEYGQGVVPTVVSDTNDPGFVPTIQVAAGLYFTIVLRADGSLVAWGDNLYGQCTIPGGLGTVIKICAGRSHSLALLDDGSVVCWGGFTNNAENVALQTIPANLTPALDIAAGFRVNAGIDETGKVYVWGNTNEEASSSAVPANLFPAGRVWGIGRHLLARTGSPVDNGSATTGSFDIDYVYDADDATPVTPTLFINGGSA